MDDTELKFQELSGLRFLGLDPSGVSSARPLDELLANLRLGELHVRVQVLRQLEKYVAYLDYKLILEYIQDEQPAVRAGVVRLLGHFGENTPLCELYTLVNDSDWRVRCEVLAVFRLYIDKVPLSVLFSTLQDEHEEVRATTVAVLGALGKKAPIAPLEAALQDTVWSVREAAIYALEMVEPGTAMTLLQTVVNDQDAFVREAAEQRLKSLVKPKTISLDEPVSSQPVEVTNMQKGVSYSAARVFQSTLLRFKEGIYPRKFLDLCLLSLIIFMMVFCMFSLQRQFADTYTVSQWQVAAANMFKVTENSQLATLPASYRLVTPNPDGSEVAYADEHGIIYVVDITTRQTFAQYGDYTDVLALTWSKDALYSVVVEDNIIRTYKNNIPLKLTLPLESNIHPVASLSTDGQQLALALNKEGQASTGVHVYNLATGMLQHTYTGQPGEVVKITWSPQHSYIASIIKGQQQKIELWDVMTTRSLISNRTQPYLSQVVPIIAMAWSPDERCLAYTTSDGILHVVDRTTIRDRLTVFHAQLRATDWQGSLAWSTDNKYIALTQADGLIQIRDALTGAYLSTYQGHSISVLSLAWFTQSLTQRIVSFDLEGNISIWGMK